MDQKKSVAPFLEVQLVGELTVASLDEQFGKLKTPLGALSGRTNLLVDASAMVGYAQEARSRFVEWNAANKKHFTRVAIVTEKKLWHMIIAAMSVASGQKMRGFPAREAALDWFAAP